MKTLKLSDASRSLGEYAAELSEEVLVLTKAGAPVAALVPLKASDRESIALSNHPGFLDLIQQSRNQFASGETISLKDMKEAVLGDQDE